jgi:hypothetical protein
MSEQQRVRRRPPNDIEAAVAPVAQSVAQTAQLPQVHQAALHAAHRGKWRRLGTLGFVLMMLSLCSIGVLVYVEVCGCLRLIAWVQRRERRYL